MSIYWGKSYGGLFAQIMAKRHSECIKVMILSELRGWRKIGLLTAWRHTGRCSTRRNTRRT